MTARPIAACTEDDIDIGGVESPRQGTPSQGRLAIPLALLAVYIIWGSTYLAIKVAVESIPPFLMGGIRFSLAGCILFTFLRLRGAPMPTGRQWAGAAVVGALLLAGGNGNVGFAEQTVASGLAAILIATVPLWAALFGRIWGKWPTRLEMTGLAVGFGGVALLNAGTSLNAHPLGALILIGAATCWALGSVWSQHLPLPGGMMASAVEMLAGGAVMMVIALGRGERITAMPTSHSLWALLYLIVFGSFVAFSAYSFLLQRVRPALATSYAYVNPAVAVALGIAFAGERLSIAGAAALLIVLTGVVLVIMGRKRA